MVARCLQGKLLSDACCGGFGGRGGGGADISQGVGVGVGVVIGRRRFLTVEIGLGDV